MAGALSEPAVKEVSFEEHADAARHPLLTLALKNRRTAFSTKIEWLVGGDRWVNYCQIVRTPFEGGEMEQQAALDRHLAAVEVILRDGVPGVDRSGRFPSATCGGVLHYLGCEPTHGDEISLRPLRSLVLIRSGDKGEFLCEVSLQVSPAAAIERHT